MAPSSFRDWSCCHLFVLLSFFPERIWVGGGSKQLLVEMAPPHTYLLSSDPTYQALSEMGFWTLLMGH